MELRPLTPADLPAIADIDATFESAEYLHVERTGEGLKVAWTVVPRHLRRPKTHRPSLDDDQSLLLKQIATGMDDGIALVAVHDGRVIASAAAKPDPITRVLRLIDLRVDFDHRRQGLASALLFQLIQEARVQNLRAVTAQANADHFPAHQLLAKLGFEPTGLDTHLHSNHDLVKESVAIFWYLTLE